ncbi:MAG TPA: SRPBCC family protein [Streptosporangiaceae bacterium]|nr:SRPBCC family protein [Streptosporangiaceae bacterium]
MIEFEQSRTVPASANAVYDQAEDIQQVDSWLPYELHVHPEKLPAVTVHRDDTGHDAPAQFRAYRDRKRLEWGTSDAGTYAGWLQVTGAGGEDRSEVTIHLSFLDESIAPPRDAVRHALDDSLERLSHLVAS